MKTNFSIALKKGKVFSFSRRGVDYRFNKWTGLFQTSEGKSFTTLADAVKGVRERTNEQIDLGIDRTTLAREMELANITRDYIWNEEEGFRLFLDSLYGRRPICL